jgi:hypothetical protein
LRIRIIFIWIRIQKVFSDSLGIYFNANYSLVSFLLRGCKNFLLTEGQTVFLTLKTCHSSHSNHLLVMLVLLKLCVCIQICIRIRIFIPAKSLGFFRIRIRNSAWDPIKIKCRLTFFSSQTASWSLKHG